MASHHTQSTLYLALPEFAAVSAAVSGVGETTIAKGATLVENSAATLASGFVVLVPTGEAAIDCIFLRPGYDWYLSGTTLYLRTPAPGADTVVEHGLCLAPAFIARGNALIIHNNNDEIIRYRIGTANYSGFTIGGPADADAENVIGVPLAGNGDLTLRAGVDYQPGDQVHLLASAASQTATVHFLA